MSYSWFAIKKAAGSVGYKSFLETESGKAELAEVEKEEIDAYYGCFLPLRRASGIKEMRPEDPLNASGLPMATTITDELLLSRRSQRHRIGKPEARIWKGSRLAGHAVLLGLCKSAIAAPCGWQLQALQILNSSSFSRLYGRRSTSKDEGDNEQNQKDDKQHVRDPRRFAGHTA